MARPSWPAPVATAAQQSPGSRKFEAECRSDGNAGHHHAGWLTREAWSRAPLVPKGTRPLCGRMEPLQVGKIRKNRWIGRKSRRNRSIRRPKRGAILQMRYAGFRVSILPVSLSRSRCPLSGDRPSACIAGCAWCAARQGRIRRSTPARKGIPRWSACSAGRLRRGSTAPP